MISPRVFVAFAVVVALSTQTASAIKPDPIELLTQSAAAINEADSATARISAAMRIVMGAQTMEDETAFEFTHGQTEGGPAFALVPEPGSDAFVVRGAGSVYTLHVPSAGKYTINRAETPLAAFAETPIAAGLANGLGGLALTLLDPAATADLIPKITSSEYLEEVESEDGALHHCRYVIEEDLTVDIWFDVGEQPVIQRMAPDLSDMAATSPLAAEHDNFEYTIEFRYDNWDLDAGLTDESFRLAEPDGAELVESFMRRTDRGPHPLVGKEAPRFILEAVEGEQVDLKRHLGEDVVILDFWATWCPPCVAALPKLDRLTDAYADQGVVFYAVNQDETAEQVSNFLEARDLETAVVLDDGGTAARSYLVRGLPTSVLIGKDGRVQVVHVGLGPNFEQSLTEEIESLIAGEDLAAAAIAEREALEAERKSRLAELRALLETAL